MQAIALSGVLTLLFIVTLKLLAPKLGLLDNPGGRKIHSQPTPVVGGIAVFLGTSVALLAFELSDSETLTILGVCLMLVAIGALDDVLDLSANKRLIAHLGAGAIMVFVAGERINGLEHILPIAPATLALLAVPITIAAVAAAINAINLSDGVDGLAGSIVLGILLLLGFVSADGADTRATAFCFSLATAITIFLAFNFRFPWRRQADVFLGDAGSTFLGFAIVWLAIRISNNGAFSSIAILWIFAVPITDTISVIVQRKLSGRPIFSAGRDHLHHHLLGLGFSPAETAITIALATTAIGAVGVTLSKLQVNPTLTFALATLLMTAQLIASFKLNKRIQARSKVQVSLKTAA